jgi:hypothetical protein
MFDSLIYALISTIQENRKLKCGRVSENIFQEFEKLNLDMEIKRFFQLHWFSDDIQVGPIIYSSENILKYEQENNFLKTGLIQIGYCPNGDEIFLRVKDFAVLYWSHDDAEDWQKDDQSLFLAYHRVESLLLNICNNNFIPWDSYSAREYFDLFEGK